MSDSEGFDEMMDIEFPMGDSSVAIDDDDQDEPDQKESSPLIDVTVEGWDDNIVSKCFTASTADYDSVAQHEFQMLVKPDKRLNVNSRKVELLNGCDDDEIGNYEQQSSNTDGHHRNISDMEEKGSNHKGTFDQKATLTTPNWAI